ncbi:MAG: glycosyltransferase, partial [Soonwooa sp.]
HLIGFGLKKEIPNLKWIADFRDPWTEISYYKHLKLTKSSDQKHRDLEKSVFENADLTLATSYTDAENFRKMGANSVCITNGFDTSSFEEADLSKNNKEKFCLGYVGVLEQLRNPENLWKAIHELLEENLDFENDFEMKFVGRLDNKILENLKASKIGKHLQILGYRAHAESYQEMKNSDLLLITNFPNNSSKGIIPGKLFEYLSTGQPILSFGPKEADVSKILNETKAGKHFDYSEIDSLKSYILQIYQLWKSGNNTSENANIETFSRRTLTKDLAKKLDVLVTK